MAEYKLIMPKMGESIAEATIISWLKNEGDAIDVDEAVLEIATDKVDSEVPSMEAGTLSKKLFNEGDVVKVGEPIAIINTAGEQTIPTIEMIEEPAPAVEAIEKNIEVAQKVVTSEPIIKNGSSNKFYSPLVMNIAKTEGISPAQLETISGTGQDGRVTKKDILAYIEKGQNPPTPQVQLEAVTIPNTSSAKSTNSTELKDISLQPGDELIEMNRMRKLIADHMVMSKHTSPHVTSFVEADVTNLVNWRNKIKTEFKAREGENFTFTPIFIEAIVKAIKDFPMINVSSLKIKSMHRH